MNFFLNKDADPSFTSDLSSVAIPPPAGEEGLDSEHPREFPLGFEPLRSEKLAEMRVESSPVVKDPFCSPLLAPDSLLKGLPPVHIVVRRSKSSNDEAKLGRMPFMLLNTHRFLTQSEC